MCVLKLKLLDLLFIKVDTLVKTFDLLKTAYLHKLDILLTTVHFIRSSHLHNNYQFGRNCKF